MSANIRFISAGAGSGKTYRITEELQALLAAGTAAPAGVIATTFTRKAAGELRERVRQKLMEDGHVQLAARMGQALIGTVNGVCGQLLERFAFEAGLSPEQKILEEEHAVRMFGEALEGLLAGQRDRMIDLNGLAVRLGKVAGREHPDWRGEVMQVASAARANNMQPAELRAWGALNADEMLAWFPPAHAQGRDLQGELQRAVEHAIRQIDVETDTTKATANYLSLLRDVRAELRQGAMPWSDWVKLSKTMPGAKSRKIAEAVQIIAGDFEKAPGLHADIRAFCTQVFDLAAESLEAYQDLKSRQGMLDYVDQERLLYELLDHPHVQATLDEELQVLFVDEFQDTSPIQLALFMKLAPLAERVVWVGDVKQAIYGFRGSDPELMAAVLDGVSSGGGSTDVLEYSWRSRPALVAYANHVFVPAFAPALGPDQVALVAKREELSAAPAIATWRLGGSNLERRARDIAFGIRTLLDAGYPVVDKGAARSRPVEYGDIAVLCRTNDRLQQLAQVCAGAGIPVAFRRPGLTATPEGALALACLRRVADPGDTLASAEIRTLVTSQAPDEWLADRLRFLLSEEPGWRWGEQGADALPALERLAGLRDELARLTPTEAVEAALRASGVREAAIAWGPTADHARHRLRNIDLLVEYAVAYEDQCGMLNEAATLPGLILWLNDMAKRGEDWQAEAADKRAVTLVTHHGAKGLEWPVVIAVDLDTDVRPRLWDLTVLQREDGFDMNEPLHGRRLRYWPWPFGQQATGIPVADRVMQSPAGLQARAGAEEETRRLLYVSFTRARDLLVLPMPAKKPSGGWLATLGPVAVLPDGGALELSDGTRIPTEYREIAADADWQIEPRPYDARWVTAGERRGPWLDRNLSPSAAAPLPGVEAGEIVEIGERLPLDGSEDMTALGSAVHAILAAEIAMPGVDGVARAARVLEEWGFGARVDPAAALHSARRLVAWIGERFPGAGLHVEHPVTHLLESGQVVHGYIDLLIDTGDGWAVVDHKATPRPRAEWRDIAAGYSGQLAMYRSAVEEITGRPVRECWIHFPVGGGLVPVSLDASVD